MKSKMPGTPILEVEVTNISRHGFWILMGDEVLFLPFQNFPWFEAAPISAIVHLKVLGPGHLYWPDLDIDLTVESVMHPERYPLVSKLMPGEPSNPDENHT